MPRALLTWNVLHRVHAENWGEHAVEQHPDEADRIEAISRKIVGVLTNHAIACLQEVSGDQLESLRGLLPSSVSVVHREAARVPKPRSGATPLRDRSEHVVVLAPGARELTASSFANDPGKGYVAAEVDGWVVISTHLTHGARGLAQLDVLGGLIARLGRPAILAGDFNAPLEVVRARLAALHTPGAPPPGAVHIPGAPPPVQAAELPVEGPRTRAGNRVNIDHVLAVGLELGDAEVLDAAGLSDHNPVLVARVGPR